MLQPAVDDLSVVSPLTVSAGNESHPVYRRPTRLQGMALETLGHAIEYLVDSRRMNGDTEALVLEQQPIAILTQRSREIFFACEAVVPVRQRLEDWLTRRLIHRA